MAGWSKEDTYLSDLHLPGAFIGGRLKLGHIAGIFAYRSYISSGAIRFRYLFGFGGFCDKLTLVQTNTLFFVVSLMLQ
jgi:hypothetical protein